MASLAPALVAVIGWSWASAVVAGVGTGGLERDNQDKSAIDKEVWRPRTW